MWRYGRSTRPSDADQRGFTLAEILVALVIGSLVITATSALTSASRTFVTTQAAQLETTQTARNVTDWVLRDLRLGGACLPVTGQFVALEGVDENERDEIVTRTGVTRDDLTCIRTATSEDESDGSRILHVESTDGFVPEMRIYVRNTNGSGEFHTIASVNSAQGEITTEDPLAADFLATSGVYAVDERRFYIDDDTDPNLPTLLMQIAEEEPIPLAVGIERMNIRYELKRDCPSCDVIDLPAEDEWALVNQILLSLTVRSEEPNRSGVYYRRTMEVAVKPRNLLPR